MGGRAQDAELQSCKVYAVSVYLWLLNMEFVEAPIFTRVVRRLLADEEYAVLQSVLAAHPRAGKLIPGAGGLRKIRWNSARRGRGKRGGLRIIYYIVRPHMIYMMHGYLKSAQNDLTQDELKMLKQYVGQGVV